MRILFWNACYAPHLGGVEIFTARLAAGLIARGHAVGVVASRHSPDVAETEIVEGVEVHRLAFRAALSHPNIQTRIRCVKQVSSDSAAIKTAFAPDLVHVNLSDGNGIFHLRTLSAHPAPTVVTLQSALLKPALPDGVIESLLDQASAVVAVSVAAAANIARLTSRPLSAIDIVYPGVPPEDFAPGVATDPPTIAFVGRLVPEKGAQVAISALERLGGNARLVVIGDGPERAELEDLVRRGGLRDRVIFAGRVNDAERQRLLARSIALVVPSLHEELFGMVAVEGALCGLPVVASRIGGLQEIVVPGETGHLCAPGDVAAMAASLARLIADPAQARRMGEAGRQRALALFTVERTVDAYERLYRESLREPSARGGAQQRAFS